MKNIFKSFLTFLCCGAVLASCRNDNAPEGAMSVDVTSINEVAAQNPADVSVALTSNISWIVTAPDWVTPSATYGNGDAILTFSFAGNYRNEETNTAPRSGEIRISGGGSLTGKGIVVTIAVNQLGHTYVDPNPPLGKIPSADEFVEFIKAANAGGSLARWTDANGEILLDADIDLSQVDNNVWQTIADGTDITNANNDCTVRSASFTGIFNGNNHKITGFNPTVNLSANKTFGLFAIMNGATVKNVELTGTLTVSATDQSDAGILAGTALNSTIQDVKVNGKIVSSGTTASKRFSLGGICGFACAKDGLGTLFKNCISDIDVEAVGGSNSANGATCAMYGGIVGFATTPKSLDGHLFVTIENCVNDGDMNVTLGRCSGIVSTANAGTVITGCTNNGNQVNMIKNGRLGNIVCNLSYNSKIVDCVNNGDIEATAGGYNGTVGGLVALIGDDTASMEGGGNYGTVKTLSSAKEFIGLLGANLNKFVYVKDMVASGSIIVDGQPREINGTNYMEHIGRINEANKDKITGITWVSPEN